MQTQAKGKIFCVSYYFIPSFPFQINCILTIIVPQNSFKVGKSKMQPIHFPKEKRTAKPKEQQSIGSTLPHVQFL